MYYKFNDKKIKEIRELNKKISAEQKLIFDALLKISKSFSDDKVSKKERDELFSKVDISKNKIKEYNKILKEITLKKEEDIEKEPEKEEIKEDKVAIKNEEIEDTIDKLEGSLKELNEKDKSDNNTSKRKKARTQLVVIEDEGISGKIKGFFKKLRSMLK